MSKNALGIITGVLIFIASGCLALLWAEKLRRDYEARQPQVATNHMAGSSIIGGRTHGRKYDSDTR